MRTRQRAATLTPFPQGATWDGNGVNFSLFSENDERVELSVSSYLPPVHGGEIVIVVTGGDGDHPLERGV